ncbi:hypothetical protein DFH08DRAFT_954459 [Mycena albidolilacea]|uniref:SRPBCC domain-containing protein n=1 Tax=Mycena albidolilacea TaxID=1033008 RepID=A0AAD7AFH5_9AGAR|nr:hypothetical protein DFH08DRAFT_954459 [Mycena albidolilacea]
MSTRVCSRPLPSPRAKLTPLAASGVFSVGASILIDAPREKVWQILIDLPSYGKWNPFTRSMTVVSKSGSSLDDQTLVVGRLFISAVNIPPGMTPPRMSGTSLVTTLEHDNFRSAWVTPPAFGRGLCPWSGGRCSR